MIVLIDETKVFFYDNNHILFRHQSSGSAPLQRILSIRRIQSRTHRDSISLLMLNVADSSLAFHSEDI